MEIGTSGGDKPQGCMSLLISLNVNLGIFGHGYNGCFKNFCKMGHVHYASKERSDRPVGTAFSVTYSNSKYYPGPAGPVLRVISYDGLAKYYCCQGMLLH